MVTGILRGPQKKKHYSKTRGISMVLLRRKDWTDLRTWSERVCVTNCLPLQMSTTPSSFRRSKKKKGRGGVSFPSLHGKMGGVITHQQRISHLSGARWTHKMGKAPNLRGKRGGAMIDDFIECRIVMWCVFSQCELCQTYWLDILYKYILTWHIHISYICIYMYTCGAYGCSSK